MKKTLELLCSLNGVSGCEQDVREYILLKLKQCPAQYRAEVDRLGNIIVDVRGVHRAAKKVMFAAHMDEVGFIVTGITSDGYVRFAPVGGIDPAVIYGKSVTVNGYSGVIAGQAIHQRDEKHKSSIPDFDDLVIDIGADNMQQAKSMVSYGDRVIFDSATVWFGQDMLKARALDDRAGCVLLLDLLSATPQYDITVAFTVQEEVGLRGASAAAYAVNPDVAVVVDSTTAADIAGVQEQNQVCRVGGGAVVSFMDKRTLYDKPLYDFIMQSASDAGIKAQPKARVAGGNDAGAIQTARAGVRVAAVSLPCRYLHSPSCVISWKDMQQTSQLLKLLAEKLPSEEY